MVDRVHPLRVGLSGLECFRMDLCNRKCPRGAHSRALVAIHVMFHSTNEKQEIRISQISLVHTKYPLKLSSTNEKQEIYFCMGSLLESAHTLIANSLS